MTDLETCPAEQVPDTLCLYLRHHLHRPRDKPYSNPVGLPAPLKGRSERAEILYPPVCTGAHEHIVYLFPGHRFALMEPHVSQGLVKCSLITSHGRVRHGPAGRHTHPRVCPVSHHRPYVSGIEDIFLVEDRVIIRLQGTPSPDTFLQGLSGRSEPASRDIFESLPVGSHHAALRAHLDAHVADSHPAFHRHITENLPSIFDETPGTPVRPEPGYYIKYHILRGHVPGQLPVHGYPRLPRLGLQEALRGHNHLYFARAYAECYVPECPVGGGMAVTADNSLPAEHNPLLRTDDMDNPVAGIPEREIYDTVLRRVHRQLLHSLA